VTIHFVKMHANGDDFIVVDMRGKSSPITGELVRLLGDRNRGIGFNQLAVMLDCEDASARLLFWNANGSELYACGSASRGVADLLMREAGTKSVTLRTNRGLLKCLLEAGEYISVEMGVPSLEWWDVPLTQEVDTLTLPLAGSPTACSMGNPHCTFFVADLAGFDVADIGPKFEKHPLFRNGTNVHFVQVIDRSHIRLRIWERGGGIPLGSGSCCCGAVVGGIRRGLLNNTVSVECDGGTVKVQWDGVSGVVLSGPVVPVFDGRIAAHCML
jgi:diaminopimelate epimerase